MHLSELPEQLIEDAHGVEPLPDSVHRLRTLFAREDWAIGDAIDIVRLDAPLTARVLQVANAPAFAGRSKIATLQQAVGRLGARTVLAIALSAAVRGSLQAEAPAYGYGPGDLWKRSVASALAAEALARSVATVPPDEAFTASLLQDIGAVLVSRHLDASLLGLLEMARRQALESPLDAERELLDLDHGEVGRLVAQAWGLPETLCAAIAHHHDPERAPPEARDLARLVWASDRMADAVEAAVQGAPETQEATLTSVAERLGLAREQVSELVERVADQREALLTA
ncbi:MAG: HDOD domain-containing protein [Myxococcota bacterium]